ncbi:Metalloproteases [Neocallimastix lanati (nom. inval.)]|nr:Metalloproteases [Neocallimastix sp. JGI-2020a]
MNIPLEKAVARYFVLNNFKNDKKNFTEKVLTYIKQSMYNRIPQIEWLDDETIEYAYKKLNSITEIIGYSEKFIDPEYLFKDFEGLEMTDDYITNSLNVKRFTLKKVFKILDLNNNEIDFGYNAEDVNAYYSLYKNSIFIPAGILQPPFFDQGLPDYINYGGIGSVVGHELTHAFDNDGKDYDINGNKSQWWTDNDIEEFEDNAQCFVNQYEKYSIKNKNGKVYYVLGENTLGENLADNGGLARAYESWKLSLKEDPEQVKKANQLLPGLSSYTMDQLFFITYGQLWCDIEENKEAFVTEYLMLLDVHSPNSARVRGVISNSKEFAKAFNCPAETSMNPKNKCQLW